VQTKQLVELGVWLAGACVAALAVETEAQACGGTFCDGGGVTPPASMQVDQTGETVLFAWGDGFVEAHIQISYEGNDASEFAWIVPVLAVPEIEVGSARLFQAALESTRPLYGHDLAQCSANDTGNDPSVGFSSSPDFGTPPPPPPVVVVQDVVGAFEYAVLDGDSAESVTTWLADNGYSNAADAPQILDEYIADGFLFVAFKLRHVAGVEDLHPVVLRYAGDEPCVPLRLTRIAAVEDMPIRVLALADHRAMPVSWRHVLLNRTRLDWIGLGENYDDLVIRAIDEDGANGRGFVTEFFGATSIVDRTVMTFFGLDAAAYSAIDVTQVYDVLRAQGLASCGETGCVWGHELVPSLLHEFVPVPDGIDEGPFYACLSCNADQIDVEAWDGVAFAAAFDERIIAPLDHAQELLDQWPVLTRLFTRVSPHEMMTDPTFATVEDAELVPFAFYSQTQGSCCTTVRLPGGRFVELDTDGSWPEWPDAMPWAERIEELLPTGGPPTILVDNTALIDDMLAERAAAVGCNAEGGTSSGVGGEAGGGGDAPGPDNGGTTGEGAGASNDGAAGCGCAATRDPSVLGLLASVFGAVLRRRRR